MPVANEVHPLQVFVGDDNAEGVENLLEADFTLHAILDDAVVVLTAADFTEVGGGWYTLWRTMPTVGRLRVDIRTTDPADGTCDPDVFEGEVTAYDIDDVAVLAARPPSITLASNVGKDAPFTIEVFKGDARTLRIPVYDEDGALLDVSGYNSFRFSIQNATQTVQGSELPYNLTDAGGAIRGYAGFVEVDLPEDCSFYGLITTASVSVYWSLDADPNDDDLTITLRAGRFIGKRKETPSP